MRPVGLLTDFGLEDHYAGVMHAVLVRDAPGAERFDIGHHIAPGDVWGASFQLRCSWPYLPPDAVVVAVVDPGVGTRRRAVAGRFGGRWLVAPDNGLAAAVGIADEVVSLDSKRMGLPSPSATFHGRDIFAPAAARLARGDARTSLGEILAPESLVPGPLPEPEQAPGGWRLTVLAIDRFGNVVTNLPAAAVDSIGELAASTGGRFRRVSTYAEAEPDEVVILAGSSGLIELAVNQGSAAAELGLARGDVIQVATAE